MLDRPLRLPSIGITESCPVTGLRFAPSPRPPDELVVGDGPVFPIGFYFGDGTLLEARAETRDDDGWYSRKVPWLYVGYEGPVLIRAGRIDGPGAADVDFGDIGHKAGGGVLVDVQSPYTLLAPGGTRVKGPGCYAYQVDGVGFGRIIVFRAVITWRGGEWAASPGLTVPMRVHI